MAVTRENLIISLIENTTMQKIFVNGVHRQYGITPCEGYVLHDKDLDFYDSYDDDGNGVGEPHLGFYSGERTERYDYDFTVNPREFYAVLMTDIPEGAEIFNVPGAKPEIM